MDRLERRVRELTGRVEQMAAIVSRLDPNANLARPVARRRTARQRSAAKPRAKAR
jgi:hypothetical protein